VTEILAVLLQVQAAFSLSIESGAAACLLQYNEAEESFQLGDL